MRIADVSADSGRVYNASEHVSRAQHVRHSARPVKVASYGQLRPIEAMRPRQAQARTTGSPSRAVRTIGTELRNERTEEDGDNDDVVRALSEASRGLHSPSRNQKHVLAVVSQPSI